MVPELYRCAQRVLGIRLWWRPPGPVQRALRPGGVEELLGSELIRRLPAARVRPFRHARRSGDGDAPDVELGGASRQQVRRAERVERPRLLWRGRAWRADLSAEWRGPPPTAPPLSRLPHAALTYLRPA